MLKPVPINEGTYENILNCKDDTYVDNTDTDKYHTQEHEPESRYSVDSVECLFSWKYIESPIIKKEYHSNVPSKIEYS